MLLALIHYKNVTGSTRYDLVINRLAAWLLTLQAADGAIQFGFNGSNVLLTNKSTEHNMDCYAAFMAYYRLTNNNAYLTAANQVDAWLRNEMYISAERRFRVGERSDGSFNGDKALDTYSWAPVALSSFSAVLNTAVVDLSTGHVCDRTGIFVSGFDFSGPPGQQPDRDAVWLEGTGQMALAFYSIGNVSLGDFYVQELEKAIFSTSVNGQGMTYATNGGTAYGFNMDSVNAAASSAAWYLFAKRKFNPFQPFPLFGAQIRNLSNNLATSSITWSVNVPAGWVRANQYIRLDAQPISLDPWGIQIYTHNTHASAQPRYIDPTPGNTMNLDSDPSGLVWQRVGFSTSSAKLSLAWRIQDSTSPVPNAIAPYSLFDGGAGEAFNWFYFKDKATPAIDVNGNGQVGDGVDGTPFTNGEDYIMIRKAEGIHVAQGNTYVPTISPDYIYFESNYGPAAAQESYQTNNLVLEFFFQ
jgi:hypothetical protein